MKKIFSLDQSLENRRILSLLKWERELKIQRRILDSLNTEHEKYAKVLHSIALIEEVL